MKGLLKAANWVMMMADCLGETMEHCSVLLMGSQMEEMWGEKTAKKRDGCSVRSLAF
jgi:hypothetical protein